MKELTFKERIRYLMSKKDENQKQLADAIGVDQTTISRYMAGKCDPKSSHIVALAKHFGVSTDFILCVTDTLSSNPDVDTLRRGTGLSEESIELLMEQVSTRERSRFASYAFNLVDEFIDFTFTADNDGDSLNSPFDLYLAFRAQNKRHNDKVLATKNMSSSELKEWITRTNNASHGIDRDGMYALLPATAADYFRAAFCDRFKEYLQNEYPNLEYPIHANKVNEDGND